jgi:hypothetical protein
MRAQAAYSPYRIPVQPGERRRQLRYSKSDPPGPATYPNRAELNRRLARQSDGRRRRFGNRQRSHQDRVIVLDSNLLACGAHLTDPAKTEVGDSRKNDGRSVSGLSKRPSRLRDSVSYSLRSNGGREHTSPPVI